VEIATEMETRTSRWPLTRLDVAGAFGDVGVLFPIAIALISLNGMNPTAVFLAAGLAYILAGAYFRIPIAVQPLKAVAAIALALHLPPASLAAAGLAMGAVLCVIGLTNLAPRLARLFTLPIVRGIQLGLGLLLAREGIRLILGHKAPPLLAGALPASSLLMALGATAILLALRKSSRFPASLVLLGAGLVLGISEHWRALSSLDLGPLPLDILPPQAGLVRTAFVALVVPQFALTFGNSIVATESTAAILYGPQARRVTTRALSLSIGVMNLGAAAIQAAPMCHGSGGITAHNKFGARSEKSSYVIGAVCLLLALFGHSALGLLGLIPLTVLGVFLIYVGIQHGSFVHDIVKNRVWLFIAVTVGLVALATTNLTWGFLVGFVLQGLHLAYLKLRARRALPAQP
jgi:SulP family sulfate permease